MSELEYKSIIKQNAVIVLETKLSNIDMDMGIVKTRMEKLLKEQTRLRERRIQILTELKQHKEVIENI